MKKSFTLALFTLCIYNAQAGMSVDEEKNYLKKEQEVTEYIVKDLETSASFKRLMNEPNNKIQAGLVHLKKHFCSFITAIRCVEKNKDNGTVVISYRAWLKGKKKAFEHLNNRQKEALKTEQKTNNNGASLVD